MGTDQETPHPKFDKYSDIENIKNFPDTIGFGESVQITEKLHGTSARFSLIDDIFMIGSRKCQLKIDVENKSLWHLVFETHDLKTKLLEIKNTFNSDDVAIYGEIVGQNIQDLNYGFKEPTLFVYDIKVNGKFLPTKDCFELTQKLNLKHVPVLTTCYFENSLKDLRLGISTLADHVREGIVIKPIISRNDPKMGRVIIKVISEDFLMRKNQKDLNYD
jgi:RNA ligase (TIGR02306 family)